MLVSQNDPCVWDLPFFQGSGSGLQRAGALPASLAAVCLAGLTKGLKVFLCLVQENFAARDPRWLCLLKPCSQLLGALPPSLPGSASSRASSITVRSPSLSTDLCLVNQWFSSGKLGRLVPHNDAHQGPRQTTPPLWCHPSRMMWAA